MKQYRLGLYEKAMPESLSWREKLTMAGVCGYDFVEISIDETDQRLGRLSWRKEERQKLRRAMEETGIPIGSMCLSAHRKYPMGHPDPAVRAKSLEIMEQALAFCADFGIRILQLAGYDVYYEESTEQTRAFFAENLRKAVKMAAGYGVVMGFETMETPFLDTVEKAMTFVKAMDSPYLGLYPDAGNLNNSALRYETKVTDDLRRGAGHLFGLHLKATKPGCYRDLYFDDPTQQVDFETVIKEAWELGVRRYVTELWCLNRPDWKENVRTAKETIGKILNRQARQE